MSNLNDRRKALMARTPDDALIGALFTLRAKPQAERTAEDRLVHAWTIDEAERRWPAAAAAVEAAFDAQAPDDYTEVDYVGILLANIPGGRELATGLATLLPPAGDDIPAAEPVDQAPARVWTFLGHWDEDQIVVDDALAGDHEDDREDDGEWPQGLWAASGTGATVEDAQRDVIAQYETAPAGESRSMA